MKLRSDKNVPQPGPHQILAKVEAVGLCFSDMKLLKQFDKHPRKGTVTSGDENNLLKDFPGYKPEKLPTVPGHEAACIIAAVGHKVKHHKPGQRVLVQTDYRWFKTEKSNASFGYNLEGALQQYVLLDERIIVDPDTNESFLIPVETHLSSSSVAMVEPWACVESSYISHQRHTIAPESNLLITAEQGHNITGIAESFSSEASPASITLICTDRSQLDAVASLEINTLRVSKLSELPKSSFDDVIYFGSSRKTIEILNDKLAPGGIINIVLGGKTIGSDVSVSIGKVHYGLTRWIGTTGCDASKSYNNIPNTGELRKGDNAIVVGAAGPMGQMHVIRIISSQKEDISVTATDFDDQRLNSLKTKTTALARKHSVNLEFINSAKDPLDKKFSYSVIMAPIGELIAQAIKDSLKGTLINIFAGIPAEVKQDIDLDTYIVNKCYMFGTSGSRLIDMKIVLEKVTSGRLDTDYSVAAVSGMAGALEGLAAVKNRTIAGKIIVYPQLQKMPLIPLSCMKDIYPKVAENIKNGIWNKQAEKQLIRNAKN